MTDGQKKVVGIAVVVLLLGGGGIAYLRARNAAFVASRVTQPDASVLPTD